VVCVSGSGSNFLYGHLDSLELTSHNLYPEDDQAIELVTQLWKLSIKRRLFLLNRPLSLQIVSFEPTRPETVVSLTFNRTWLYEGRHWMMHKGEIKAMADVHAEQASY
jgi:hypothetical protein